MSWVSSPSIRDSTVAFRVGDVKREGAAFLQSLSDLLCQGASEGEQELEIPDLRIMSLEEELRVVADTRHPEHGGDPAASAAPAGARPARTGAERGRGQARGADQRQQQQRKRQRREEPEEEQRQQEQEQNGAGVGESKGPAAGKPLGLPAAEGSPAGAGQSLEALAAGVQQATATEQADEGNGGGGTSSDVAEPAPPHELLPVGEAAVSAGPATARAGPSATANALWEQAPPKSTPGIAQPAIESPAPAEGWQQPPQLPPPSHQQQQGEAPGELQQDWEGQEGEAGAQGEGECVHEASQEEAPARHRPKRPRRLPAWLQSPARGAGLPQPKAVSGDRDAGRDLGGQGEAPALGPQQAQQSEHAARAMAVARARAPKLVTRAWGVGMKEERLSLLEAYQAAVEVAKQERAEREEVAGQVRAVGQWHQEHIKELQQRFGSSLIP